MNDTGIKNNSGFTLIEVIISVVILFMTVAAVFHFYSQRIDNHMRIKEKYNQIRIAREFVDTMINDPQLAIDEKGRNETEAYTLQWHAYPIEEKREVVFSSGKRPTAQLKRIHLDIVSKTSSHTQLSLDFLVNVIAPPQ